MHLKRFTDHINENKFRETLKNLEAQNIIALEIVLILHKYLKGKNFSKMVNTAFEAVKNKKQNLRKIKKI